MSGWTKGNHHEPSLRHAGVRTEGLCEWTLFTASAPSPFWTLFSKPSGETCQITVLRPKKPQGPVIGKGRGSKSAVSALAWPHVRCPLASGLARASGFGLSVPVWHSCRHKSQAQLSQLA